MAKVHVSTTINGEPMEFLCEPNDTMLDALRGPLAASVRVEVPDTLMWTLVVAHEMIFEPLRIALWVLSLLTVALLGYGLIRERRQTVRVAGRSAELDDPVRRRRQELKERDEDREAVRPHRGEPWRQQTLAHVRVIILCGALLL